MKFKCEIFLGSVKLTACLLLCFIAISSLLNLAGIVMGQQQDGSVLELEDDSEDLLNRVNITVSNFNLTADLALSSEEQAKGLSIKENLQENEGMIFPYNAPKILSFWMKDMKFPIDIIWLDADKRVVHIEKNLQPCSPFLPCPSYSPDVMSQYVLETVAGFSDRNGITIGTQVEFSLPIQG
jgi:uncharacterized membrane protein (UPF0127 family)